QVVAVPGGLVAVGSMAEAEGDDSDGVAWYSPDGIEWAAAVLPGDLAGPGAQGLTDVVATDADLVAVGYGNDGRLLVPAAWKSSDGREWLAGRATFGMGGPYGDNRGSIVEAVHKGPGGLVATGGGLSAHLWQSPDGASWGRVEVPGRLAYSSRTSFGLLGASDRDVLVGSSRRGSPFLALVRDGSWTEITATADAFPPPSVEVGEARLAGAGTAVVAALNVQTVAKAVGDEGAEVRLWRSGDGERWERQPGGDLGLSAVGALAPSGAGAVAVGNEPFISAITGLRQPTFLAWDSRDGGTWTRHPPFGLPGDGGRSSVNSRSLNGVAVRGRRAVAAGSDYGGGHTDGVAFVRDGAGAFTLLPTPSGMGGPGDQEVTDVCAGAPGFLMVGYSRTGHEFDALAWFSADGLVWGPVEGPGFSDPGDQLLTGCAATPGGFVAVGSAAAGTADDAAFWTGPGAGDWRRIDPEPAGLGGPGPQGAFSVAAEGDELVAVGFDNRSYAEIAVWRSSDGGNAWRRVALDPSQFRGFSSQSAVDAYIAGGRAYVAGVVDDQMAIWSSPLSEAG
ncbi:MAG: hypothetical protein ACRD0D_12790, partial [Acidimicrobiales bacterium]